MVSLIIFTFTTIFRQSSLSLQKCGAITLFRWVIALFVCVVVCVCECGREGSRWASLSVSASLLGLGRSASSSPHCAVGHASRVCLAELIKTVNRLAHLKGERERAGARKVK